MTPCRGILFELKELETPHVITAMQDVKITYTHQGYVYFSLVSQTRKVLAYYDQRESTTVLPGGLLEYLKLRAGGGDHEHAFYPIPDTVFIWNNEAPTEKLTAHTGHESDSKGDPDKDGGGGDTPISRGL